MYQTTVTAFVALALAGSPALAPAAAPAIGMVSARGSFLVDDARVSGNATLFEGTVVETDRVPSELQWLDGPRTILDADSRGRVYRDRLVLERGQGQVFGAGAFRIEAASLRVSAVQPGAAALVALNAPHRLQVSALRGSVRVTNSEGILLANIAPGRALELEAQAAGAAAPSRLTGTLLKRNDHFLLTDEVIGVTFELRGDNLDSAIGRRVELTGTLDPSAQPVAGAAQTLRVAALKVLAPGVAGAGVRTGMSGATKAIVAGVVAAGATAGTAIGLTRGEDNKAPISK